MTPLHKTNMISQVISNIYLTFETHLLWKCASCVLHMQYMCGVICDAYTIVYSLHV